MRFKFLFIFLLMMVFRTHAYLPRSGNILATISPYWNKTDYPSSKTNDYSPILTGVSLVANGDTWDWGSLEVAMIYAPRLYYREQNSLSILEKIERMHITMGYRWWLNPYFSTSLALFSSYSMGDPSIVFSQFSEGSEIDTSARDTTEYGLDWAVQGQLFETGKYAVIAEARYSHSLTSKEDEKSHHYGISIGLRYLIQGAEAGTEEAKKIDQAAKKDIKTNEVKDKALEREKKKQ